MIPRELPQPSGYELAARYESSQIHVSGFVPVAMAGGDYYDVFELDDQTLVLLVGDASGHGIKACMSIMTMHTLIRVIESQRHDLHRRLHDGSQSSSVFQRNCPRGRAGFITLLYSTLDLANHRLAMDIRRLADAAAARSETQMSYHALGNEDHAGLPLAIEDRLGLSVFRVRLPKNSRLLIYTDGLEEAFPMDRRRSSSVRRRRHHFQPKILGRITARRGSGKTLLRLDSLHSWPRAFR